MTGDFLLGGLLPGGAAVLAYQSTFCIGGASRAIQKRNLSGEALEVTDGGSG